MKLLRDKAGVSLIFVLAAMMLLMAIGVSAITAAGLNYGAGLVQRDRNQLEMYVGSMERTLRSSLEDIEVGAPILDAETLGGWVLREAYLKGNGQHVFSQEFVTETTGITGVTYTVIVKANMNVQVIPSEPIYDLEDVWSEPADPDEAPVFLGQIEVLIGRTPGAALINGTITISQFTEYVTPLDRRINTTTETTYMYSDCLITEWGVYLDPDAGVNDADMVITELGLWTVTKREKVG